ncbi:hypothetical protein PIB30_056726 [Stylosanthes scabra]|uniref:BRCA1-A complex subunit Abraxas n=1 Tax=Stylosanthes scabra TaxID=79078 RepID=A0ABU6XHE5_9FABA|nr:hypothetical protein [Stylosanthes scabra]
MDDHPPLQKIAISGPTLASLIQRFSTSPSSLHGLLFGHVTLLTPLNLSDDPSTASSATTTSDESTSSATLVATVTGFIASPSPTSTFYDSTGTVTSTSLSHLLHNHHNHNNHQLIGWFSARRKTPLRPSMREFSVTQSLSSLSAFSSQIQNSPNPNSTSFSSSSSSTFSPCIFILLSSPFSNDHIHTHEYRAYQLRASSSFEPKLIDIVNIGPAFRGHYGSFSPNAPFPVLECDLGMSSMNEERDGNADKEDDRLSVMREKAKDQRELDGCAEGFEVGRLRRMMGSEARSYTSNLEGLYEKMLAKVENLTRLVEQSNAKVLEQEHYNRKLRQKIRAAAPE